ncbi:Methyl-accepting chemotaxis protein (MCP) signalling domain-containing protein [Desulfacinum hydrothermale DSM 13146]|uniref:Methyl-accepting chemotaxis protein (MCP) signalling domain-containing protein n=1 Tax=Desulfacinum hydrothermale DSM 13146 TaxID=1121390 RepID=A0A1W1XD82_9BACT|nr:methyl-accepting chemotaxis protein [Desulfacinum hydrothermale]SMC21608.1 Methyl-accepting chemotaxis protein (MCP) signalling domain-containing protein [Desulfacinum hydrothermale DSM 13146]
MLKKFGVQTRFIAVVVLLSLSLVGVVVGLLVVTASKTQNELTSTMVNALREEQKVEKDLLLKSLVLKGESLAGLLAHTGSTLIVGYDFASLLDLSQSAAKDPDVAYVVFYDKKGKALTEEPTSKEGLLPVTAPVSFEGEELGTVEVGLSRDFAETSSAQVEQRIDRTVKRTQVQRDSAFRKILLQASTTTFAGVIALCLVVYWAMVRLVSNPVKELAARMRHGASSVLVASDQLAEASQTLAEAASEQAAGVEETSSSLEEMNSMTRRNADNAGHAASIVKETHQEFEEASGAMTDLQGSMKEISKASEETQKIIKTIDEIAFQTNLLSLNAAVEAARAGEAGAGFAVVADEVRNLAMRAAEAARNTSTIIEDIMKKVQVGSQLVDRTSASFGSVKEKSTQLADLIGEIAEASREQASGIQQISRAISDMDRLVQRNAANAEETASSAETLRQQSQKMERAVNSLVALVEGERKGERLQDEAPRRLPWIGKPCPGLPARAMGALPLQPLNHRQTNVRAHPRRN